MNHLKGQIKSQEAGPKEMETITTRHRTKEKKKGGGVIEMLNELKENTERQLYEIRNMMYEQNENIIIDRKNVEEPN